MFLLQLNYDDNDDDIGNDYNNSGDISNNDNDLTWHRFSINNEIFYGILFTKIKFVFNDIHSNLLCKTANLQQE